MDPTPAQDLRLAGTLALTGAAVAVVGNVLHPVIPADATNQELVATVTDTSYWVALHLLLGAGTVLIVAALVLAVRAFTEPGARRMAVLAAVTGGIGGVIFTVQVAGLDGIALPALAGAGVADDAMTVVREIDIALLSLSIAVFLGAAVALLGAAALRSARFPAWLGWLALVAGLGNLATGTAQAVAGLSDLTITYLFRPLAALVTIALIGFGLVLRRLGGTEAPARKPGARTSVS